MVDINIGTSENSGTGDKIRNAFIKVNENFIDTQSQLDEKLGQDELGPVIEMIDGKADLSHTHQISQVFGLSGSLANKADKTDVDYQLSVVNNTVSQLIPEAPVDGRSYIRRDGYWVEFNVDNIKTSEFILNYDVDTQELSVRDFNNNFNGVFTYKRAGIGQFKIENDNYNFNINNTTIYFGPSKSPLYSFNTFIDDSITINVLKLDINGSDLSFENDDYGLNNIAIKINYKN